MFPTKHTHPCRPLIRAIRNAVIFLQVTLAFPCLAEPPEEQPDKNGVHWAKINYYKPLPGSMEPDTSELPGISMSPNQLIEYNEQGRVKSITDFERGTDDVTLISKFFFWDGTRLKKRVMENSKSVEIDATTYTYDADGHLIGEQTKTNLSGRPGSGSSESTERIWEGGRLVKTIRKNGKGTVLSESTFTYDAKGRKERESFSPAFLISAKIYTWDEKGNMLGETQLDKSGRISNFFDYAYDSAGRVLKQRTTSFDEGKVQSLEVTDNTYDPNGGLISTIVTTKEQKVISNLAWRHTYDKKGSRIQTTHIKNGKPIYVEVRKLTYYP